MLRIGILLLSSLLLFVSGSLAVDWDFVYEGDKLPDPAEWETYMTDGMAVSDIAEVAADGSLHVTDPDDKVMFFIPQVDGVENSTMEIRAKVLSQAGASYTILFGIEDAAVDAWIGLFPDRIQLYDGGPEHFLDMTDYHVLRLAKVGDKVTVYADDEMVIEGPIGSIADDRQDNIVFGTGSTGGTGEYFFDYVVYTGAGAFSPEELPNYFISTQAVESKGKAAACWGMIKSRY